MCNHHGSDGRSGDDPCEGDWINASEKAVSHDASAGAPTSTTAAVDPVSYYVLRASRAYMAGEQVCISCELLYLSSRIAHANVFISNRFLFTFGVSFM